MVYDATEKSYRQMGAWNHNIGWIDNSRHRGPSPKRLKLPKGSSEEFRDGVDERKLFKAFPPDVIAVGLQEADVLVPQDVKLRFECSKTQNNEEFEDIQLFDDIRICNCVYVLQRSHIAILSLPIQDSSQRTV